MRVLVAIDASDASQAAVREVAARPWPGGSEFAVLTVVEPAHLWTMSITASEAGRRAQELVDRAAAEIRQTGHNAAALLATGDPKTVILDTAKNRNAELIVLGSHGPALKRFLLGNVAAAVTRHAPCSVEIVRAGENGKVPRKLLVATDGSPFSEAAVRSVAERPWPEGTEVRVVSAAEFIVSATHALLEPPFFHSEQVEQAKREGIEHAQKAVGAAAEILRPVFPNVSESISMLLTGPREAILEEARLWGAGLIVLGSHGRGGMDRFLMGSVSEAVAAQASCSVEVIRASAAG